MIALTLSGCRIYFRPIADTWEDAMMVTRWRNRDDARASFFCDDVVTPGSHSLFMARRDPHDLVWMVHRRVTLDKFPLGMLSIIVDVKARTGEYGRLYIDPEYKGQGYAKEAEFLMLWAAFEWLRLDSLWLDALTNNVAVLTLHDKTGWTRAGVDVPGHTNERGPVQHMTYSREAWRDTGRGLFVTAFPDVGLPAWE